MLILDVGDSAANAGGSAANRDAPEIIRHQFLSPWYDETTPSSADVRESEANTHPPWVKETDGYTACIHHRSDHHDAICMLELKVPIIRRLPA